MPVDLAPETAPERSSVAALDQALWKDLTQHADEAAFAAAWIGLACRSFPRAIAGVLLLPDTGGGLSATATWPAGAGVSPTLAQAAQAAAETSRGVVQPPLSGHGTSSGVALPIVLDGAVAGVAGLEITLDGPGRDVRAVLRHLQWAAAWVRERLLASDRIRQAAAAKRMALAIDLLAATLEQDNLAAATRVAATELAARLACERVSIGFVQRGRSRVASISHSAAFGERMSLTRAIEAAMDEAIDQHAVVLVPPPDDAVLVTRATSALARAHALATVLTVPMLVRDDIVGALTFERPADRPFAQQDVDIAEAVAAILGPAFADKRAAERWILPQIGELLLRQARRLFGPRHFGRKLGLAGLIGIAAAADLVRADYAVHAHARITGTIQRAVVAPFDGFLRQAPLHAGDRVRAGDLLAAFDDRDLVLERLRWITERQVHTGEYDEALSAGKRADAVRFQSQIAEADAQTRLADEQLARTRITAPFDGLIVSGDMSQSIGAPMRRGDVMFELAPLNDYRVDLQIAESQVADVEPGQAGDLVLASLPAETLALTVERVTPVADAKDGAMTFHAEALLTTPSERLRPGMEGVAKIGAGRARLVWIWSRSFLHWLRVATWAWTP